MSDILTSTVSIAFAGISFAMILFIISVGLSITMGLMGFANLAHGAFAMLGGYIGITLTKQLGIPFLPGVVLVFLIVAAISVPFEKFLYARFYSAGELEQVLLTIALVFIAIAICTFFWGPLNVQYDIPSYLEGQVNLGFRSFPTYRSFIIVVSAAIIVGLWYGLERTRIGAQIRAAVDNRRMAQSVGINVDRLFTLTFALGSGLAAVGGSLGTEVLGLTPTYALDYLVYFLVVVSVGGMGSIRGAFVASLVIGIIDTTGKYYLPHFGAFFIFVITIVVLLWRPAGLFGRH